ncbi:rho GTPase-activating protein 30-like [Meleagris gallopavo]|uniref:rho GTPase-activating protein 30-like n=1 Tax=Meleagris gallopavo TaxID=9103 RepID=UPI0012AB71AF|nr:rho GTPase-activating protein 30-like [Meleagris gallopavo]
MSLALKARQKAKRKGGGAKERVFGCDLLEHLQQSGKDVPQVLRSCTEFVEQHGVVDGIYRLSGVSSNIQRLRQEFDGERSPDLQKDVYLQDIHCVSSLCKAYFRELPNPLLTYRLYDRFADAVATQMEEARLVKIKEVLKELPPPHYRTLEFLMRHLLRMASYSHTTNMHARNLAIVWAPNLLRSRDIEATGFNGTAAFMEVRVQSIVVEFILTHVEQLFGDAPLCGGEATRRSRLFPGDGSGPYNVPAALSQGDGPPPIRPYHTIIELSDHRRKGSLKAKKWKSIFHLGRSDAKRKLGKAEEKDEDGMRMGCSPADDPRLSTTCVMKEPPQRRESFDTCSSLPPTGTFPVLEESPEEKLIATEEPRGPESESESSTKSEPTTPRPGRMAVVGARSRAEKCAGVHISGPFSVTVPLHITSNLSRLTRGQQCPALAQHGAIGSPLPTRRLTKESKPPQTNTEEDARLSLELRDSFAFLDCQDAWLEHGDGDTAVRAVLGHGGPGDSDEYPAIEEGMESGFMNPGESPVEQPDSYLSIEECMDEEMFYMAPSCSDTEEPTGDTDSDDMFLSAHDELSPLAADPETPTNSMALEERGAELWDGCPPPEPCPAEEVAPGDGGHLEDPCGDIAEEEGQIPAKEEGGGGDREGNNGWSRTELGLEDGAAEAMLAPGGDEEMDGAPKQSEEGDPQPLEVSPAPEGPFQELTVTPLPQESVPNVPPTPVAAAEAPPTPMAVQEVLPTPMAVPEVLPTPMAIQGVPPTPMAAPEEPPTPAATTEGTEPPPEAITPTPQGGSP